MFFEAEPPDAERRGCPFPGWCVPEPDTPLATALQPTPYVNLLSENEGDRIQEASGDNHERLAAIKGRWDPDNLFRHNQNVEPAG